MTFVFHRGKFVPTMKFVGAFLFSLVLLAVVHLSAFAQVATTIPTQEITPTPIPSVIMINYQLPYPGILPGSTLYPLKAIRDKIEELLISDPLKKSNFYLLQADKRLAATISLIDLKKDVLAEQTLSKGQNYLEKSLENDITAKGEQKNTSDILAKIRMSSIKQTMEIQILIPKTSGVTSEKLKQDLIRAKNLENLAERTNP